MLIIVLCHYCVLGYCVEVPQGNFLRGGADFAKHNPNHLHPAPKILPWRCILHNIHVLCRMLYQMLYILSFFYFHSLLWPKIASCSRHIQLRVYTPSWSEEGDDDDFLGHLSPCPH